MKKISLIIIALCMASLSNAKNDQKKGGNKLVNYKIGTSGIIEDKALTDYLIITYIPRDESPTPNQQNIGPQTVISNIVGPVATIAFDIINAAVAKSQAKYSATYSSSNTVKMSARHYNYLKTFDKVNDIIDIMRVSVPPNKLKNNNLLSAKSTKPSDDCIMAEYVYDLSSDSSGVLKIRLDKIQLNESRAKLKNPNEYLSIAADFKLNAVTSSPKNAGSGGNASETTNASASSAGESGNGKSASGNGKSAKAKSARGNGNSAKGKSTGGNGSAAQAASKVAGTKDQNTGNGGQGGTQPGGNGKQGSGNITTNLGESIITIPFIQLSPNNPINIPKTNKLVNEAYFNPLSIPDSTSAYITLSVTYTEANLNHLEPSMIANLIANNSGDIVSVLKALFPSGSSGSSSSK